MKSYVVLILTRGISALSQMVIVLMLASKVDASEFGFAMIVFTVATVVASLSDFGLGSYTLRTAARGEVSNAVGAAKLSTKLSLIIASISLITLFGLSFNFSQLLLLSPLVIWALAERNTDTRNNLQIAFGHIWITGSIIAGRRVGSLGIFFLLQALVNPLVAFSVALCIPSLIGLAIAITCTKQYTANIDAASYKLAWSARSFGITGIAGQVRNLDTMLVGILGSGAAAGVYGLGTRISAPILIVYQAISSMMLADSRRMSESKRNKTIAYLWIFTLVSAGSAPLLALLAGPIIRIYVPWLAQPDMLTIGFLLSMTLMIGHGIVLSSMLVSIDLEKTVARLTTFFSISILTVIVCSIHFIGVSAAALSAGIGFLVQAIVFQLIFNARAIKSMKSVAYTK